jgi:hypothetical protein
MDATEPEEEHYFLTVDIRGKDHTKAGNAIRKYMEVNKIGEDSREEGKKKEGKKKSRTYERWKVLKTFDPTFDPVHFVDHLKEHIKQNGLHCTVDLYYIKDNKETHFKIEPEQSPTVEPLLPSPPAQPSPQVPNDKQEKHVLDKKEIIQQCFVSFQKLDEEFIKLKSLMASLSIDEPKKESSSK